jgi:hypothetical protein
VRGAGYRAKRVGQRVRGFLADSPSASPRSLSAALLVPSLVSA